MSMYRSVTLVTSVNVALAYRRFACKVSLLLEYIFACQFVRDLRV